jgi:anti-anti-sigma factor
MSLENTSCIEHTALRGIVVITMLDEKIRTPERVQQIKDAIINVVGVNPCKSLVIDMSNVKFIGSMGFLVFLAVRRLPTIENVILCNLDGEVASLFMLCRLISADNSGNAPLKTATSVSSAIELCDH